VRSLPGRRFRGGEYWIWYWAVRVRRSSEVMDMKTIPSWTLCGVSGVEAEMRGTYGAVYPV
jgi:hypothetical protein